MRLRHLVSRAFQAYWRRRRGLRLGAEACIVDSGGKVLVVTNARLVRWSLPGTGVRKGEALEAALARCLRESCGIEIATRPHLYWIFTERSPSPFQKTGLFVVRDWEGPMPSAEVGRFFGCDKLAEKIGARAALRVKQALEGRAPAEVC